MSTDKPAFNKLASDKKKVVSSELTEPRKRKPLDLDEEASVNDKKDNEDPMLALMGNLQQSVERVTNSLEDVSGISAVKMMGESLADRAVSALGSLIFDKEHEVTPASESPEKNVQKSTPFHLSPMSDSLTEDSFLTGMDKQPLVQSPCSDHSASLELESSPEFTMS
ncbi:hypothetical protein ELY21_06465 [Legionella sp. km535]|uniref:hypothetical protein n=1 Tax=Legionella sp. km535 TaxID=2498107 RepID=UPI000F8CCF1C|nr:hypothetical protein [Legionella sp. km535]RUR18862.1 hypothetical protein ELY21_06465 [Legionella sp. km535]